MEITPWEDPTSGFHIPDSLSCTQLLIQSVPAWTAQPFITHQGSLSVRARAGGYGHFPRRGSVLLLLFPEAFLHRGEPDPQSQRGNKPGVICQVEYLSEKVSPGPRSSRTPVWGLWGRGLRWVNMERPAPIKPLQTIGTQTSLQHQHEREAVGHLEINTQSGGDAVCWKVASRWPHRSQGAFP